MNNFLQTRDDVNECSKWLKDNAYVNHGLSCKDWELCNVTQNLTDGNLLDAGADGSFVLHNAIIKKIEGKKIGIDLYEVTGTNKAEGAEYYVMNLMNTSFSDESFKTITSCSVLEHQIDFELFAKEMSRLLKKGGQLFVSFDYSGENKIDTSLTKLYSLDWNILSKEDAVRFIEVCENNGLIISTEVNWTVKDMVINPTYCSPASCEYTFGLFEFIKK